MTDEVSQLLIKHLPPSSKKTRTGYKFNCPMCRKQGEVRDDTKMRGGLKLELNGFVYNCFNCKFSTGYSEGSRITKKCLLLLKTLGADINQIPISIRLGSTTNQQKKKIEVPADYKLFPLPENSRPILDLIKEGFSDPNFNKVVEYMSIETPFLLLKPNVYWSPSTTSNMNKRFILPFYWNGKVVGWTARYFEKKPPAGTPKYMMERPENYIYNIHGLKPGFESVLVLEGPLDAESVDGLALMTNAINNVEAEILHRLRKKVIVVPDMETTGLRLAQDAGKYGFYVSLPKWPKGIKDCAECVKEYGKLFTLYTIYESVFAGSSLELEARFKIRTL